MEPTFFPTPADMRSWLVANHVTERELLVGFRKVGSGQPSVTWPQSVDEALCFGWIDGVRRRVDDATYTIRFTPRKKSSIWSAVNIKRVAVLQAEGRMQPAGLAAYAHRKQNRSGIYAYENRPTALPDEYAKILSANEKAATFFAAQAPSYRRTATWHVVSAKQEETRRKRLEKIIAACEEGKRLF